ncbi:MAG: alpha/beta fold hydrolase [Candidatus Levybacteria bacterium]|nr:alpha/beta fold hydrolase [Candidatus Levybacteria bacterium]
MEKKIEFIVDNTTLRGSLFIPSGNGPFPAVIFFHGSGGIGETYFKAAKTLSRNGILGFAFNYRGAGVSDGEFSKQTLKMGIEDAKAALNFLMSQDKIDKQRLGLCGASFGGFIAALLCTNSNAKSLILIGPVAYSPSDLGKQRDKAGDLNIDFRESDSYKEIAKFKGKFLMVTSEFDEVIPPEMISQYLKSAKLAFKIEEHVLKGAKHRISINPKATKALIEKTSDWFLQTL